MKCKRKVYAVWKSGALRRVSESTVLNLLNRANEVYGLCTLYFSELKVRIFVEVRHRRYQCWTAKI